MPIFQIGGLDEIGLSVASREGAFQITAEPEPGGRVPKSFSLRELPNYPDSVKDKNLSLSLAHSAEKWSLYLKSISLYKSFEGFIANLFNPTNDIYFLAILWDYSGEQPIVYPPKEAQKQGFFIPMRAKTTRQFIGDGVNLWPSRTTVGALNVAIFICESDLDARGLGQALASIHDSVKGSKLVSLIASITADPTAALVTAIGSAVIELEGVFADILKCNKDDRVDLFQGSFGTERPQVTKVESVGDDRAGIELEFVVSA